MLSEILSAVRARLGPVVAACDEWKAAAADQAPVISFEDALIGPGLSVIAEIKRRSPSKGALAPHLDPVAQVRRYEEGGAAAVSVLTEPDFFGGSLEDLAAVRAAVSLPVLRKDFIIHPAQVWQARAHGADAVLLIVAALSDNDLVRLMEEVDEAGMTALVEVHNAGEAARAVAVGPRVIGVNNRDLSTFVTDLGVAEALASQLEDVPVRVAESGVSNLAGAQRMVDAGYDAILVGEALVRAGDPTAMLSELTSAVRST